MQYRNHHVLFPGKIPCQYSITILQRYWYFVSESLWVNLIMYCILAIVIGSENYRVDIANHQYHPVRYRIDTDRYWDVVWQEPIISSSHTDGTNSDIVMYRLISGVTTNHLLYRQSTITVSWYCGASTASRFLLLNVWFLISRQSMAGNTRASLPKRLHFSSTRGGRCVVPHTSSW